MREAFLRYWRGVLLAGVGAAGTIWLAASGQLGLYIHPRYFGFTAAMAGIAAVLVVVALLLPRQREHDHADDGHEHGDPQEGGGRRRAGLAVAGSAVLLVATAVCLLALPPAALSTSLAGGRDLNATGAIGDDAVQLAQADPAGFTVKDWATLIAGDASPSLLQSAQPELLGFVIADPDEPESAFAIARYVMTCCAVDAQPVGVTVRMPGWQDRFQDGDWVAATGRFIPSDDAGWELSATAVEPVEQPAEPYVY